jgi:transcriptional regulator with XRE-family HTH domain
MPAAFWQGPVMDKSVFTHEYRVLLRLIRQTREAANLTQVELAEKLRQSQSFVSKCERGERRLDVVQLRTICRLLGTSLTDFVAEFERRLASKGSKVR